MNLEQYFPNLRHTSYRSTSPASPKCNCIAWVARDESLWWWPDAMGQGFWPPGVTRVETLRAFQEAFGTLGFSPCDNANVEPGFEKVAVYAKESVPARAARQLPNGNWTSKLGPLEDIEHKTPDAVEGDAYGKVVLVLRRPVE